MWLYLVDLLLKIGVADPELISSSETLSSSGTPESLTPLCPFRSRLM